MILGEAELTGYARGNRDQESEIRSSAIAADEWVSQRDVADGPDEEKVVRESGEVVTAIRLAADEVEKKSGSLVLKANPDIVVESRAFKMSKSRGNVINPDDVVQQYGADSLRLYEMFMGPLEQVKPWSMSGVEGVSRFLGRVWRMIVDERADDVALNPAVQDIAPTAEQDRILHKTIKAVTDDVEKLSFNTAISRMMEFTNAFTQWEPRPKSAMEPFVLVLSPFAPHIAEELWNILGHRESLAYAPWPTADVSKIAEADVEIPIQLNGKVKGKIRVPVNADKATMQQMAEADPQVQGLLFGKTIAKVIAVPGRMVNFVVQG
jgi:leucyl-tRNA synthetase